MTAAELRALLRNHPPGQPAFVEACGDILAALDDAERVATERVTALVEQRAAEATRVYDDRATKSSYTEGRMDALNELVDVLRESAKGDE